MNLYQYINEIYDILHLFIQGVGEWLIQTSVSDVPWVDMSGLLKSFPIIFLAFNCQTSLLPIYNELPNPSMKKMTRVSGQNMMINVVDGKYCGYKIYMLVNAIFYSAK